MAREWHSSSVGTIHQLDDKRARVLELLLAGESITKIALALGLNRTTIWRMRQSAEFQAALAGNASERQEDIRAELEAGAIGAAEWLRAVAEGREPADAGRQRAVEVILARAVPATAAPDALARERAAISAALGGPERAADFVRAQVAEAMGLTMKVGA